MLTVIVFGALLPVTSGAAGEEPQDVADAEETLAEKQARSAALEARLAQLEADLTVAEDELADLVSGDEELGERLVNGESEVREYAVNAYVHGGDPQTLALASNAIGLAEMALRDQLLAAAAAERRRDVADLGNLRAAAGQQRSAAAADVERLNAELVDTRNDLIQASAHEREAEDALERARRDAWTRAVEQETRRRAEQQRQAEQEADAARGRSGAGSQPSAPMPAPGATGIAGDPTAAELRVLAKIRHCESRGNYSITSPSGKYRGAYQFDRRTWAGVGGTGDPAAAPPAEQDYRALMLYRSRGGRPWPNCS